MGKGLPFSSRLSFCPGQGKHLFLSCAREQFLRGWVEGSLICGATRLGSAISLPEESRRNERHLQAFLPALWFERISQIETERNLGENHLAPAQCSRLPVWPMRCKVLFPSKACP